MKIRCKYDELVDPNKLKPHPKNRNKHPGEQIKRLSQILEYQGFRYPIKVSKASGFIISGHARLEASKLLNLKEVPVNYQDYDSDEQEYADLQADNAIAFWSDLDFAGINSDIGDLGPDFDLDLLGIKGFEVDVADKKNYKEVRFSIEEEFIISVECKNEEEQKKLFLELNNRGLTCKIIS